MRHAADSGSVSGLSRELLLLCELDFPQLRNEYAPAAQAAAISFRMLLPILRLARCKALSMDFTRRCNSWAISW